MINLQIKAGSETEEAVKCVMENLPDSTVDELKIEREYDRAEALATEPITAGAIIIASIPVLTEVSSWIRFYLEQRHKHDDLTLVLKGDEFSPEVTQALWEIAKAHPSVKLSIEYARNEPGPSGYVDSAENEGSVKRK